MFPNNCNTLLFPNNCNTYVNNVKYGFDYRGDILLMQGCKNPGHQVAWTTTFCTLAPNVCRSSVWKSPHANLTVSRILR